MAFPASVAVQAFRSARTGLTISIVSPNSDAIKAVSSDLTAIIVAVAPYSAVHFLISEHIRMTGSGVLSTKNMS